MKLITIVGARPQFVKAAMVGRAIGRYNRRHGAGAVEERLLHTGQHYDARMNDVFFRQLDIRPPAWQLQCGQGSHGAMTARMLEGIERVLLADRPDAVLVYGDTNSTLAGALAAAKLHVPVVHVEAGLRSFNRRMPEEINRVVTDHVSTLLFCPTTAAVGHLANEGIREGVYHAGDVMYDAALAFGTLAQQHSAILTTLHLAPRRFYLATVHRAENTDDRERLSSIIRALAAVASDDCPVVLPLHPRTRMRLEEYGLLTAVAGHASFRTTEPVDYLDMVMLEKQAAAILTDSGGVQKEAYFHRTPCVTLRDETEWTETVDGGWNLLAGHRTENIVRCLHAHHSIPKTDIAEYGTGRAADDIVDRLTRLAGE
ncbi:MAG: UDP-N-acetylglucosamine 2-epimerase (non-hydrolyzing) [Tannerella sp.]|jgi:UDP-GlcNAc3NAcA epimerase|nr:UDP-N-acetylglucosamine 2-epimerase (non-hydrolyzing) [Tannerella sp.]